jgi:hypothetical protein
MNAEIGEEDRKQEGDIGNLSGWLLVFVSLPLYCLTFCNEHIVLQIMSRVKNKIDVYLLSKIM